jgi:hypothetical protein
VTRSSNLACTTPWTLALAAALAGAGLIHCLLTPEHMAMSAIFGAGFLAAGVGQLGMAGLAVVRPSRLLYAAVIASTVALSSMYAYNVLVGLPFHDDAAAAAAGDDHADEDRAGAVHSAEPAHSDEAGHSEVDEHSDDVHPSDEATSSAEAGHAEGDDPEEPAETDHHEDGLVLGGGEPVDAYGAVTQFAQFSAAAIAAVLLARSRRLTV